MVNIREELAALLREHAMPSLDSDYPRDEYECCADAILARFGVVELPEPDMGPDPEDEPDPRDGMWDLPFACDLELFRNGTASINGELYELGVNGMRAVAAALLAAANRAEAQA